jgi:hypothetical protein
MRNRRSNFGRIAQRWLCVWCCALSLAFLPSPLFAQDDIDPVESAGEALRDAPHLPWYDAATDEVQPVPLAARDEPPPRPTSGTAVEPDTNQGKRRELSAPQGLGNIFLVLGVVAICAVFVVVFSFILSAFLGQRAGAASGSELERSTQSQADRVEELPLPLKRAQSDLLGEARRQYEQGDYNEAIIYLYSYLLVELDKASRIRLVRGKTNRQYLTELRESPELVSLVGETMIAFEDVYFGDRTLSRERFEACYQQLDTFHAQLELTFA